MRVEDIHVVACVGAGTIGSSWATLFAQKGYRVHLYDISDGIVHSALSLIEDNFTTLVRSAILSEEEAHAAIGRIRVTTDLADAVRSADFVQESGPESYGVKKDLFREMDALTRPDVILSSSSSGLVMTEIQKAAEHPDRCVVSHPFNPPHIVPLVEIVRGGQTSDETVDLDREFMLTLGKVPVVLRKEVRWYIANRLQNALFEEAIWLVGNGIASAAEVDIACRAGPGLRWALMGPFTVMSLASPGGLEDILLRHKFSGQEENEAAAEYEVSSPSPEVVMEWMEKCVEDMNTELAGKDRARIQRWRDEKLLQILELLKSD